MSPRDRKRDRVLKRRRETKKKERQNDCDDTVGRTSCVARDEHVAKKAKTTEQAHSTCNESGTSETPIESSTTPKPEDKVGGDSATPSTLTKEERQRLKNQQRKALRKEKKARKQQLAQEISDQKKEQHAEVERLEIQQRQLKKQKQQAASCLSKSDFTTLSLGVQYKDIVVGKGRPVMQDGKEEVRVGYKLRAHHGQGKVLDTSADFRFRVGTGQVVKGMRQGGVRHLIVPPEAGYGRKNVGAGPNGVLFFEITLLSC